MLEYTVDQLQRTYKMQGINLTYMLVANSLVKVDDEWVESAVFTEVCDLWKLVSACRSNGLLNETVLKGA